MNGTPLLRGGGVFLLYLRTPKIAPILISFSQNTCDILFSVNRMPCWISRYMDLPNSRSVDRGSMPLEYGAMNPWFAKTSILLGGLIMGVIRATYRFRSRNANAVVNRMGRLEVALLALVSIGFVVPFLWVASSVFVVADYSLHLAPFVTGILCLALGLLFFGRAHAALGTNWSATLKLHEGHELITQGIYGHIRHPMYLALLLYSLGQALVVPNLVAGPSCGVAMVILIALRVGVEERLMLEHFGKDYEVYMARTKRLVPGVW